MNVHIFIPYSIEKNLGKAYNQVMSQIPEGDAACLMDYDVQLLTPDAGKIVHHYANQNPDSLLTCFTNRVNAYSKMQLLTGQISEDTDLRNHIELAEKQKIHLYKTTPINRDLSGMLMIISKDLWKKNPFPENGHCLGIDTTYSRILRHRKIKVLRCDGLYVFHAYRLQNGVMDKSHLL